jgi:hypothetical protein
MQLGLCQRKRLGCGWRDWGLHRQSRNEEARAGRVGDYVQSNWPDVYIWVLFLGAGGPPSTLTYDSPES